MFYGDLYGSFGPRRAAGRGPGTLELPAHHAAVAKLVLARRLYAYGAQTEYFADDPLCVGFTRRGRPGGGAGGPGLAVLMSAAACAETATAAERKAKVKTKRMHVGAEHAGERWTDILATSWKGEKRCGCEDSGVDDSAVVIDEWGWATFSVGPRSVSVWVDAAAEGRDVLDGFEL